MKKRSILLSMILIFTMMFTACGSNSGTGDPFEGTWKGTIDVTDQFEDGIIANYPDMNEYVDFEDLEFIVNITFADGVMNLDVDQNSIDAFVVKLEAGMQNTGYKKHIDDLKSFGMTLDEVVFESGMSEEEYLASVYKEMKIDQMISDMEIAANTSLEGLSNINGTYTFNQNEINLRYDEETYESFGYVFDEDELEITIKGEGFTLLIECEKQ